MKSKLLSILMLLLLGVSLSSSLTAQPQAKTSLLVIAHANVIDGVSSRPLRDATVIVREWVDRKDRGRLN